MKKTFIWIFVFICLIMPNIESINIINSDQSLGTFKQNNCINLIQLCSNCSFVNITSVLYPDSSYALSGQYAMTKSGTEYNYSFCNTSILGKYIINGLGDLDGINTIWNYDFSITQDGKELSVSYALIYLGSLFIIVLFLLISIFGLINVKSLPAKYGFVCSIYLFTIALTYISWTITEAFINSPFLVWFLWAIFYILIIFFFPFVILSLLYLGVMMYKLKEINSLIEKGVPESEIYERMK